MFLINDFKICKTSFVELLNLQNREVLENVIVLFTNYLSHKNDENIRFLWEIVYFREKIEFSELYTF